MRRPERRPDTCDQAVAGTSSPGGRGWTREEEPASPMPPAGRRLASETNGQDQRSRLKATDAPASIDLNALHKMSPEELAELAKKFGVLLNPGRTRHYHILDVARAALGSGSTVTAEGFIDQPGESLAFLRWPELNFCRCLKTSAVPRATLQKFWLRGGQRVGGKLRLPRDREKSLVLDEISTVEGDRCQSGAKNRFRKVDAAISRGPDHAGERQDEIIERAGGRFAGAARARSARPDCVAAARGQNDFVEGNRKSDSGKSSARS